jgi:hypothetical protein
MHRVLGAAIAMLLLYAPGARPQSTGVIADGTYGYPPTLEKRTSARKWTMARTATGGFLIDNTVTNPGQISIVQDFQLSADWRPVSYSFALNSMNALLPSQRVLCKYAPASITCTLHYKRKTDRASLDISGPRVFLLGLPTDVFWLSALECIQVDRTPGKVTSIAVVSIADNAGPAALKLEVVDRIPFRYMGQEKLTTSLGTFLAHKFTAEGGTFWTSDAGLLLAMTVSGGPKMELYSLHDSTDKLAPTLP